MDKQGIHSVHFWQPMPWYLFSLILFCFSCNHIILYCLIIKYYFAPNFYLFHFFKRIKFSNFSFTDTSFVIINLNYALWFCFQSNESTLFGKNATLLVKHKDNATHVTSWRNMMTWFVREGIFFQFDASEVVSVVKENLGTLISVSGESA